MAAVVFLLEYARALVRDYINKEERSLEPVYTHTHPFGSKKHTTST